MFAFLKKEPTIFLFRKMWRFTGAFKSRVVLFLVLSLIAHLIWLLSPLVFGEIINEVQSSGFSRINYIYLLLASLAFIELAAWVFHGPSRVMENTTGFKIDRNYKQYLYKGVLSLPLSWHTDHDSGDTIDKINKSTAAMYDFSRSSYNLIRVWVSVIGTTSVLLYYNLYVALLALLILGLGLYVIFKFDQKLVPQYKQINEFENKASAKVFDSFSNITSVKVLGIHVPVLSSIMSSSWASYATFKRSKIFQELKWFSGGMLFTLLVVVPLVFYVAYENSQGRVVMVGTLSTLYLYLQNLIGVYYTFASMYEDMIINKARMQNIEGVESAFEALNKSDKRLISNWKRITISNLEFKYNSASTRSEFTNFNFVIGRGEKIAFIGESGSGKSTLLKILHGMYETASAEVSIDGGVPVKTNFADLDLESTLVPQEPEVFSASIRENITLLLDFTDEEIRRASDAAMFTDVIEQLPRKIESVVNEKGVNLSGGQKQRLALTRALLFSKDKKIMLLDESTSSVDPINEVKIYKNIFENFRDATIIASIHKMNLLKYFDRIVILEKGVIRNQGSFNALLAADAEFKKSWDEFVLSHKGEEV